MAFPVVEGRQTGSTTTNATTHSITFPAPIQVGELLVAFVAVDGSSTLVDNEGAWLKIAGQQKNGTTVTGAVFAKIAEGGSADNLTVVTGSEMASWVTFRISGHGGLPTGAWANGSSTNSDPPNHTPPYGAQDYLWIAGRMGDAQVPATAAPASYSTLTGVTHSNTAGACAHTAERSLNASSENPGTFTSATEQWAAVTIAVPPASMAFPRLKQVYYKQNSTAGTTSLVTSSFTPADNELIVVKAATNDVATTIGTPTGGSLTYTRQSSTTAGSFCYTILDTAQVGTSPGSMAVTVPFAGDAGVRAIVVERWELAKLDATPAVNGTKTGSGAPSATLTTEAANSVVSWVNSDWNVVDPAAYAYRADCVEDAISIVDDGTNSFTWYAAYQYAASAASQTIGLSTPAGQAWSMHGVEVQYRATDTAVSAGNASGTGTANQPTIVTTSPNPSAGNASGTGTANDPTIQISGVGVTATAGNASATGTAYGPKAAGLSCSFTDGVLTGEYHIWTGGLPTDGTAGLVVHFHGDEAYEHLNPNLNYGMYGNRGLPAVANRKGYIFVSALAPDVTGTVTWWENGAQNTDYFAAMFDELVSTYNIDTDNVWLSGYSGGAVFITEWFVPEYGSTKIGGGGAVIVGGGDQPATGEGATNNGFSAGFKANFEMHWLTGAQDDGTFADDSFDALASAQGGQAYYSGQGFATAEITSPLGHGHELDGAFGPILDDYLPALSGFEVDDTPGSTRPTLITSQLVTATGTTTLTATAFTPDPGEVIVVKLWNADLDSPNIAEFTPDELTWATIQHTQATNFAETWIFTAVVPDDWPTKTVTPSVTWFGTAGQHGMVVERWRDAQVKGRQTSGPSPTHSTGAPSATATPTTANSVLTWLCVDWDIVAGATTYRSSATQTQISSTASVIARAAYQNPSSATSQTMGMTAPMGQTWTLAAIELLPAADPGTVVSAELASGTGTANAAAPKVTATAGNASGTGTANQAGIPGAVAAGHASGTGTANNALPKVTVAAGNASGVGTANQPSISSTTIVTATAGNASGTGTANDATASAVNSSSTALAGLASGTGTAYDGSVGRSSAELASGTGTANNAAAAITATAQCATGSAEAFGALISKATVFLPGVLDAALFIEFAWGADITADPDSWVWTDVFEDVLQPGGKKAVVITVGRSDEADEAQPATCKFTVDNTAGTYQFGPASPLYPNVRRGTPCRIRIRPGPGSPDTVVRFQGYVDGFSPEWDSTGVKAITHVSASGVLRRLEQGSAPVQSTFRRTIPDAFADDLVAYWPCEDGRDSATIAPGIPGVPVGAYSGLVDLADDDTFYCSAALPRLNEGTLYFSPPNYTSTGETAVRFLASWDDESEVDNSVICRILTTGTAARWDLSYGVGGTMTLTAYSAAGTVLETNGPIGFDLDGAQQWHELTFTQDGADIDYGFAALQPGGLQAGSGGDTVSAATLGVVTQVVFNPDGLLQDTVIGHVTVHTSTDDNLFGISAQLIAYSGELTAAGGGRQRIDRLCDENNLTLTNPALAEPAFTELLGSPIVDTARMGPQLPASLLALLREVEAADQALMSDGLSAGLYFRRRAARENLTAALTLDATAGVLSPPFEVIDDDAETVNKVTAERTQGTSYTHEDTDGPHGTEVIGTYDTSFEVNTFRDAHVPQYAGWLVHLGTIGGYRYPAVELNLARNPELAEDWLGVLPGHRIDITNLGGASGARPQLPDEDVSLQVLGWTETLSKFAWTAELNTAPYDGWRVIRLAADSGDTSEFNGHLRSDGSTLASPAGVGDTSISVATPSGPLWTTTADDCPFYLEVGGQKVQVTAISGGSSPQTFTLASPGLTYARDAGTEVDLWVPPVPKL